MTDIKKAPLMYNGWLVRKIKGKYGAYNFRTDIYLNPLYSSFEKLKLIIDAL